MKQRTYIRCIFLVGMLLLASCATTDDPHKGGLIGYLATGDEGYQNRIDQKEQGLSETEDKADREERKTSALESHREDMRAKLQAQRDELNQIETQTKQLLSETQSLKNVSDEKESQKQELLASLADLQSRIQGVKGDSSLLIAEKQKRIDELKEEVNKQLELYSLLATM